MTIRKLSCVLVFMFMISCSAFADEIETPEVELCLPSAFLIQRELGNSLGFRTKDGLSIMYMGTFRNKQHREIFLLNFGFALCSGMFSHSSSVSVR